MLLMSGCLPRHPCLLRAYSLSRSRLPPFTPGPSQRRVLLTLHCTARATSCPPQLPSEDGPAQRSWVWMGCAEAVPPIPRWVTASLLPSRCVRLLMASLDRGECYVLPNIPQWHAAPHSPIKQIYIHNKTQYLLTTSEHPQPNPYTHSPQNYPEPLGI